MSKKDIRKYLNLLTETKESVKEHGYPDIDDPDTGRETKVEIEFKDGDQIEVEVYASGVEELKRLMDLAGIFHKDKQSGTIGGEMPIDPMAPDMDIEPGMDMVPDMGMDTSPIDVAPDMVAPDDMGVSEPMDLAGEPDMGMDGMGAVDMDTEVPEIPPTGGPDVPAEVPMDGPDMGADMPELDFDMSNGEAEAELEEGGEISGGKRFDYGNPNPNLGQEKYSIDAHSFSGGAAKPVRFVPARSGDNAMVDAIGHKGLREYVEEITQEKKDLSEVDPTKVGELVAKIVPQTITSQKRAAIDKAASELENAAKRDPGEVLDKNPEQVMSLITGDEDVQRVGLAEPDEDQIQANIDKFGKDFDEGERKRRYSFKQSVLPFQGLTGVQRISRNAMRASKKSLRR